MGVSLTGKGAARPGTVLFCGDRACFVRETAIESETGTSLKEGDPAAHYSAGLL